LQQNLKDYFEQYVFKVNAFPSNWSVEVFSNQDDAFNDFKKDEKTPYCFGLTFNKFDVKTDEYDVSFHF
jgi:hypothetical protein